MNKLLHKNLEALNKRHSGIVLDKELVDKYDAYEQVDRLAEYDGWQITSSVDRLFAIDVWCNQFEEITRDTIVFVYGLSDLDYFVELRKRYPDTLFLVYSPSDELLINNMATVDYTEFLLDDRVGLCAGERAFEILYSFLNKYFEADCMYDIAYAFIPNFVKMYETQFEQYQNAIYEALESKYMSRNTLIEYEDVRLDNYLNNLQVFPNSSNLKSLKKSLEEVSLDEYPAVIVATGPSLDKNVDLLAEIKGKACVFCVDASIKTMNAHSLRPDIILSVDPNINKELFASGVAHELPLVYHMVGSKGVVQAHAGKKIVVSDIDYYLDTLLKDYDEKLYPLEASGSVAHCAYSLASQLGFKRIILIGQDLGFTDNKQHADGAFEGEKDVVAEEGYFYVDGVNGDKILTNLQMDHYKKWFENNIEKNTGIEVIDATEGGALIKGTKIMTFRDAIDTYCMAEPYDFEGTFTNAPNMVEGQDAVALRKKIDKTFTDIDENIKKMERIKRDYYTLRNLNDKGKYKTSEFKNTFKRITDFNNDIETNPDYMLYKMCCNKAHYDMLDAMTETFDNAHDEINALIKQGLTMIDAYIDAGKRLKEEWRQISEDA